MIILLGEEGEEEADYTLGDLPGYDLITPQQYKQRRFCTEITHPLNYCCKFGGGHMPVCDLKSNTK
jgi:hypothetical protein